MRSRRWVEPCILTAAGLLFFGLYAPRAGIHLDDHALLWQLSRGDAASLWNLFIRYVAGRNLYIPLFYALQGICAGSAPAMHWVGLAIDVINSIFVLALARRLGLTRGAALAAGGLFLVWPNHGETHWWTCAIQMNLLTTGLTLGAFLVATDLRFTRGPRLFLAAALYATALFDYDQVFFLWIALVALARWADPKFRWRPLAATAGGFFLLDVAHFGLRIFGPYSSGGRPVPRADVFLAGLRSAIVLTIKPLREQRPVLDRFPGGWAAALMLAGLAGIAWAALCARGWSEDEGSATPPGWLVAAVFGAAWWTLAYIPNLFWYTSPRHNYLPSVGTALMAASLAWRFLRQKSARVLLAAGGACFFAFSGMCAWSDGAAWAASTEMHERFAADASALPPAQTDAVFLVGAPKEIGGAPAFMLPGEHLYDLARRTGTIAPAGDISIAPNRLGVFFGSQPELFGNSVAPSFTEARQAAVYAPREGGGFERICRLSMSAPGVESRQLEIGVKGCPGRRDVRVPLTLVSVRTIRESAASGAGPTLISARMYDDGPPGTFDLVLTWRAGGAAPVDFASSLVLLDAAGRELYRPRYAPSSQEHDMLWPLFDDSLPPSRWKSGQGVIERYRLRRSASWPNPPARLRLVIFERRDGAPWGEAGIQEVPLRSS